MATPALHNPSTPRTRFRAGLFLGICFIIAIFAGIAVFAIVRALGPAGPPPTLLPIAQRKPAPLSMPTLDGKTWSTADHTGQVILLNYFATWCPPCMGEMPELKAIAAAYAPRGVAFAAISLDTDNQGPAPRIQTLTAFNTDNKLPFPILLPPAGSPLFTNGLPIPQTFLLDRHGRIAVHITGETSAKELSPLLDQLLKE
jgi:thiol-disulfide isomerase/thioredoxin